VTQIERLLSALAERERMLRDARTAERHAGTLMQAMDLIYGCEDLECGIGKALRLCQEATRADLWMLLRRSEGVIATLAIGEGRQAELSWPDVGDCLAGPRRVTDLREVPWCADLPAALRSFRSLLSVPVNVPGEPPMAIGLLSRREAAFSRFDQDLLCRVGRLLEQAIDKRRLAHRNAVLARVVDTSPGDLPPATGFLDTSFEALSRAYARVAEWQGKIVDITNELLGAPAAGADPAIDRALARTGSLARSDRTYVFRLRAPDRLDNTHEWVAPGIAPMIAQLQDMPASLLDEWRADLGAGRAVSIPDVEALPETSAVREVLRMQGIRSLLAVPMLRDGEIAGFMGFDAVRTPRRFLPIEIQLLQSVANAVHVVLDRATAEAAAEAARAGLEAERNRLHATLVAIPDLVLELDHEGRFVDHVAGAGLQAAFPAEQFLGRMPEDVLPPELAALARRVMRIVDRDGRAEGQEYQLAVDGTPRWFTLSAAAKTLQGVPAGYVFVIRDVTARLNERRQLQRLGQIAALTSNLVVVTDAAQRIEWVNPAFERRTGWTLEEVRGKPPGSILTAEESDADALARIEAARLAGEPVQVEMLQRSRTGERFWVRKDIQPVFDSGGRLEGFVAVQTDITELKRKHQRALRDRAAALDASSDGIAITDAEGRYVYMNAAHRRLFGIGEREDVRKLNWRDLLPAEAVTRFMAEEWSRLEADGVWRGELPGLHRDGSPVAQEVSLTLRDKGILCITRDISERRRLESALKSRVVALDASRDGIAITDGDGHYVYMNAAHRRMFGIGDDEDVSKLHWQAIYPPDAVARFVAEHADSLMAGGFWRGELHGRHRDGRSVPQEVSLTLHEEGIVCITRDISDRLRLEAERARLREELQLAQRRETIAHLASGVAHDLNNLVAVVAGSASLLMDRCAGNDEVRGGLERILRATDTARDLVEGLGHLGRPQAIRAEHDLRRLIAEAVELLGTGRIRDHAVSTVLPDEPCPVWGNVTEILQVIVNLALNACQATGDGPNKVSLAVSAGFRVPERAPDAGLLCPDGRHTMFTVSDTGTGIERATRARLFERYFSTKGVSGTGLGLPIVASILRDNCAALWLDSSPGRGTTVTVAWPTEPLGAVPAQIGSESPDGQPDLAGHKILVVDDQADVADVLAEMLETVGAIAVTVSDPQEALDLLRDNPGLWSALVTGLDMPNMCGPDLARSAAACHPRVPSVLVTALPEAIGPDAQHFQAVLSKPIEATRLIPAVRAAVSSALPSAASRH